MPKTNNTKKEMIGFRGSESEKAFLTKRAEKNGMNLSQYMRMVLLEENADILEEIKSTNSQKNYSPLEQDLIKFVVGTYDLVNIIAHQNFKPEELDKGKQKLTEWLERKGYKTLD